MLNFDFNQQERDILREVADLYDIPAGAFNIRKDGVGVQRRNSDNITISPKEGGDPGIDIRIKPGTKGEQVHIPVIVTQSGLSDLVYNDFYIGEGADVTIIAGCGIHNDGCDLAQHNGIHRFFVEKGARMSYVEKHYAAGSGTGERILNPVTELTLAEDCFVNLETVQISGVTSTKRTLKATLDKGAELLATERLLTTDKQQAESLMHLDLNGEGSKARIISRSVAQGDSYQLFDMRLTGSADCFGHIQCDSIIMDNAKVRAIPELTAAHVDAELVHEAAIGRIAGDQIQKLMTLGLDAEEAEDRILTGFLK